MGASFGKIYIEPVTENSSRVFIATDSKSDLWEKGMLPYPADEMMQDLAQGLKNLLSATATVAKYPMNGNARRKRGMQDETKRKLENLLHIRFEKIKKSKVMIGRKEACNQAIITTDTVRTYARQLFDNWDDATYLPDISEFYE